jgi:hypothetical protein
MAADQLTQDDITNAHPEIDKRTEQRVANGRWHVPGYHVSHASAGIMVVDLMNVGTVWRPLCSIESVQRGIEGSQWMYGSGACAIDYSILRQLKLSNIRLQGLLDL